MMIKVCGMRETENIRNVEKLGIEMMGFIFYPKSPRNVDELPGYLPEKCKRVGVFVNEDKELVFSIADRFGLDYIQLHGKESPGYCKTVKNAGLKIIKAFSVETQEDLSVCREYEGVCDYYLFDTKTPHHGGSGKQFDWSILSAYNGETSFLLSGGINPYSTKAVRDFSHPLLAGYDLNSRFELSPGIKSIELLKQFIQTL